MKEEMMEDYLRWQKPQHQTLRFEGARTVQTTRVYGHKDAAGKTS